MDGRDIGTVVFPQAELKIFMTAPADIRAKRRYEELKKKGEEVSYQEVYENVLERDHIDSSRSQSPLKKAPDARVLDNGHLKRDEQFELALSWALKAIEKASNLKPERF